MFAFYLLCLLCVLLFAVTVIITTSYFSVGFPSLSFVCFSLFLCNKKEREESEIHSTRFFVENST
jgi:hypothetical protein